MPNGFHNDPSLDLIFHRHAEHGHYKFHTHRTTYGFISVHVEHHGGYAYDPLWDTLDLSPFVRTRRHRPTRADMDELAADLISKLVLLQSSNPRSTVRADRASALLLLEGWYVLLGRYFTYVRTGGEPFEQVVPPVGSRCDESLRKAIETKPELHYLARDTSVMCTSGLMFHAPGECVYDLEAVDELLASTVPLHEHPEWSEIARAPIDSLESTGRVVMAMRNEAVAHGSDHVVIRFRNHCSTRRGRARRRH
jgi:hypothetical protein